MSLYAFNPGVALALDFIERSGPQLDLAQWLESQGANVAHVLNVAGPIAEHDIIAYPQCMFDFAEPRRGDAIRAVVQVALGEDSEMPIDLVAWTRDRPDHIFRCLGTAQAIGIDQLVNPASYFAGRPLRIYRSALAWLVAGCDGIVPLDCAALRRRFDLLPFEETCRLAAEDLAHGRALRDAWAPLPTRIRILVPCAETA